MSQTLPNIFALTLSFLIKGDIIYDYCPKNLYKEKFKMMTGEGRVRMMSFNRPNPLTSFVDLINL